MRGALLLIHRLVSPGCRITTTWARAGYYLHPLIMGGTTYGFSPMDFLRPTVVWLLTISRVRATYASSSNFGFEYCLREDKVSSKQLCDLDLSSLRVTLQRVEPVRPDKMHRFLERFLPYGLRPEAHIVAYGLAENTLAVTHYGRRVVTVNQRMLQQGKLHIENPLPLNNNQLHIASCGKPLEGIRCADRESGIPHCSGPQADRRIWITGKSVCQGYWNRPKLTQDVFRNTVANDPEDRNAYLRTGDLAFLDTRTSCSSVDALRTSSSSAGSTTTRKT